MIGRTINIWLVSGGLSMFFACGHAKIAGTQVRDNASNRAVVRVIRAIQKAYIAGDESSLLQHVSTEYFEDMGTSNPEDDYDYAKLRAAILPAIFSKTSRAKLDIEVLDVRVERKSAVAEVRYVSRAAIEAEGGVVWSKANDFNQMTFAKENGDWMLISGL